MTTEMTTAPQNVLVYIALLAAGDIALRETKGRCRANRLFAVGRAAVTGGRAARSVRLVTSAIVRRAFAFWGRLPQQPNTERGTHRRIRHTAGELPRRGQNSE